MIDGGCFIDTDPTTGALHVPTGRALVASFRSIYLDTREGNLSTAWHHAQNADLIPMAVVSMNSMDTPSAGFAAVLTYPPPMGWSYRCAAFYSFCRKNTLPLSAIISSREDLLTVVEANDQKTVMVRWLGGGGYNLIPDILAICETNGGFVFDVSTITQSGGIEFLVKMVGADRLFLASNAPLCLEKTGEALLAGADLTEADRAMIESGTLTRILGLD